jgi:hypothetical protein
MWNKHSSTYWVCGLHGLSLQIHRSCRSGDVTSFWESQTGADEYSVWHYNSSPVHEAARCALDSLHAIWFTFTCCYWNPFPWTLITQPPFRMLHPGLLCFPWTLITQPPFRMLRLGLLCFPSCMIDCINYVHNLILVTYKTSNSWTLVSSHS